MLPSSLNPADIARFVPRFRHWFRYPLRASDFRQLREHRQLRGYYASKPLYGHVDARGRVDRSAGFSGGIVALFVPSPARSWTHARLLHAQLPPDAITRSDGSRDWPAIRAAAAKAILASLPQPD